MKSKKRIKMGCRFNLHMKFYDTIKEFFLKSSSVEGILYFTKKNLSRLSEILLLNKWSKILPFPDIDSKKVKIRD